MEAEGGFRTLLQKEGANRRAGLPNWPSDARPVGKAIRGVAYGAQGVTHDTRKVLPAHAAPNGIVAVFRGLRCSWRQAPGGHETLSGATRAADLGARASATFRCGQAPGQGPGFKQAMSEQRLKSPTLLALFGDLATNGRGQQTIVGLAREPRPTGQ